MNVQEIRQAKMLQAEMAAKEHMYNELTQELTQRMMAEAKKVKTLPALPHMSVHICTERLGARPHASRGPGAWALRLPLRLFFIITSAGSPAKMAGDRTPRRSKASGERWQTCVQTWV